jgi:hypothetical protein
LQEREAAQRAAELATRALAAEKRLVDAMKDEAAASAELLEAERAAKFAAQVGWAGCTLLHMLPVCCVTQVDSHFVLKRRAGDGATAGAGSVQPSKQHRQLHVAAAAHCLAERQSLHANCTMQANSRMWKVRTEHEATSALR